MPRFGGMRLVDQGRCVILKQTALGQTGGGIKEESYYTKTGVDGLVLEVRATRTIKDVMME